MEPGGVAALRTAIPSLGRWAPRITVYLGPLAHAPEFHVKHACNCVLTEGVKSLRLNPPGLRDRGQSPALSTRKPSALSALRVYSIRRQKPWYARAP